MLKSCYEMADYTATCPKGHPVNLSTGYTSAAPVWWTQHGYCETCKKGVERMVGMKYGTNQVVAGPTHWYGERTTKDEEDWIHDVLNEHSCERCKTLAKEEVIRVILNAAAKLKEEGQKREATVLNRLARGLAVQYKIEQI